MDVLEVIFWYVYFLSLVYLVLLPNDHSVSSLCGVNALLQLRLFAFLPIIINLLCGGSVE